MDIGTTKQPAQFVYYAPIILDMFSSLSTPPIYQTHHSIVFLGLMQGFRCWPMLGSIAMWCWVDTSTEWVFWHITAFMLAWHSTFLAGLWPACSMRTTLKSFISYLLGPQFQFSTYPLHFINVILLFFSTLSFKIPSHSSNFTSNLVLLSSIIKQLYIIHKLDTPKHVFRISSS